MRIKVRFTDLQGNDQAIWIHIGVITWKSGMNLLANLWVAFFMQGKIASRAMWQTFQFDLFGLAILFGDFSKL
jgi:hypothetical protein